MIESIGDLTKSVQTSVLAEARNYSVQADSLGKWANAWENVTARIQAEGPPTATTAKQIEVGLEKAATLRAQEAALRTAVNGIEASQAWGRAIGALAGGLGAVVGIAQIIDGAYHNGADGAGEKTLGVLLGMGAGALVISIAGVGFS